MAKQENKAKQEFVSPFTPGVNYEHFTTAMGDQSVEDYCKGNLTTEQIEWLINDLKHYKK